MERQLPVIEEEPKELVQREAELWQLLRELRASALPFSLPLKAEPMGLEAAGCHFLQRCSVQRLLELSKITQPELWAS